VAEIDNILATLKKQEVEYDLGTSDFAVVTKVDNTLVDVQLLQRNFLYKSCILLGNYIPNVNEKGMILFVSKSKYPCFLPFYYISSSSNNEYKPGTTEFKSKKVVVVDGQVGNLTYPQKISDERMKEKIQKAYISYSVHKGFVYTMIMNPCKSGNVNPMLIIAIAIQESGSGTLGRGKRTHNPGNIGNVDDGSNKEMGTWENGWVALINNIARRIRGWTSSTPKAETIEQLCGYENGKRDLRRPIYATQSEVWINNVTNNFIELNGSEGF